MESKAVKEVEREHLEESGFGEAQKASDRMHRLGRTESESTEDSRKGHTFTSCTGDKTHV